ncbi:Cu-binding protein [Cladochytrium tenue]|nr:Cu-binding protein [Cladochytrium tenue]
MTRLRCPTAAVVAAVRRPPPAMRSFTPATLLSAVFSPSRARRSLASSAPQGTSNAPAPGASVTGEDKNRPDFTRFGWKSMVAIAGAGASLFAYFVYERRRAEEQREARAKERSEAGKPLLGGPFCLVDAAGGVPVTDLDFRGSYMLMYFGYTFCPDVCPEELDKMAKVVDNLKAKGVAGSVVPIFISCDPKRDSLDAIGKYVKEFHPDFRALTGTNQQIRRVARAFRMYYSAPPRALDDDDADYLVDHSIFFYLVGPDGTYRTHFGRQETADSVTARVLEILAEDAAKKKSIAA